MIYFCHIPKTSGTSVDTSLIVNKDKIKFRLSGDSNELESEATLTKYLSKCKARANLDNVYALNGDENQIKILIKSMKEGR